MPIGFYDQSQVGQTISPNQQVYAKIMGLVPPAQDEASTAMGAPVSATPDTPIDPLAYQRASLIGGQQGNYGGTQKLLMQDMAGMELPKLESGAPTQHMLGKALVGALLARLIGGKKAGGVAAQGILGGLQQGAQMGAQTRNQQAQMEYQRQQNILGNQIKIAGMDAEQADNLRKEKLGENRYQQSRIDAERARTEAMTKEEDRLAQGNRQGFATANTPAEARYFARLSQGTKFAVSPDELRTQIQALGQPRVKEFNARVGSLKDKFDVSDADTKALAEERQQILDEYGLPPNAIPPVLNSKSYKQMAVEQRNQQIKDRADQFKKTFDEKVKMNSWLRNIKFPQDLAVKWAMVDVAKNNSITMGMNGNVNAARYEQSLLDSGSNEIIGKLDVQLQKIRQDMIKAQIAYENPVGKNDKEKQANAAKALQSFKALTEQMKYVRHLRDEQNKNRSEGGLSVLPDREDQAGAMGYAPVNPMSGNITPRGSMGARPASRPAVKPNASALRSRYNY